MQYFDPDAGPSRSLSVDGASSAQRPITEWDVLFDSERFEVSQVHINGPRVFGVVLSWSIPDSLLLNIFNSYFYFGSLYFDM